MLARNGAAPVGDLRYFADTKLDDFATPIAKAQLAAALGMLGDQVRAERVYAAALAAIAPQPTLEYGRTDYGSVAARCARRWSRSPRKAARRAPTITGAVERVEAARGLTPYTSTQENAWMVLAARALAKDAQTVRRSTSPARTTQGALNRSFRAERPAAAAAGHQYRRGAVAGGGDGHRRAARAGAGGRQGLQDRAALLHARRQARRSAKAKQNDRFAVVLQITEPQPQFGRIIVADYLPAGFEIDNPRLVSSGDTGTLPWIEDAQEPVNSEFRDDRFSAAFDRKSGDPSVFTVAYVVRAVSPGTLRAAAGLVEDMYRPDRFGRTATGTVEVTAAK